MKDNWEQPCASCGVPMRDERCPNIEDECLDCCGCDEHRLDYEEEQ